MRIVAFGSSHTTGYNLDDTAGLEYNTLSKFAYPQVTADMLNCECLNLGRTGNGIDQIYVDVFAYLPDARPDDFIIIHLPINTAWFRLITPGNDVESIVKPDSLTHKGKEFKTALYDFYGTLAGENHWIRLWYIQFYSLITLLTLHNKKFVWFFDSKSKLYFDFEEQMSFMPEPVRTDIQNLKRACPDPKQNYAGFEFTDHLCWHLPNSLKECGHHNEQAHRFWAGNILVPYIKHRLT